VKLQNKKAPTNGTFYFAVVNEFRALIFSLKGLIPKRSNQLQQE
jgi:hypothetical protein